MTSVTGPTPAPAHEYRRSAAEVVAALGTDPRLGPSDREAAARLARYGRNELAAEPPVPAWRRLLAQFQSALVLLPMAAAAISAAVWAYERDAAPPGGFVPGAGDLRHAQTMAFTTLTPFQLFNVFNVFNARSADRSAFVGCSTTRGSGARSRCRCRYR